MWAVAHHAQPEPDMATRSNVSCGDTVVHESVGLQSDLAGWRRWAAGSAVAGIYMIAAGMSGAKALQSLGLVLLIGASLRFLPDMLRRFARDPLAIAVALFFVYLLFAAVNATWEPGDDIVHWDRVRKMSRVLLVPVVAYWLASRRDRIERLFLVALAGMLAVILAEIIQWGGVAPLLRTDRVKFEMNPIWMGLNASFAIIGLLAWRRNLQARLHPWMTRPGAFLLWLFLLVLMLQVVIVSQSRGAYVAFGVGIFAFGVLCARRKGAEAARNRGAVIVGVIVTSLVALLITTQLDVVAKRFLQEQATINAILSGDVEDIHMTPIGKRMHMYIAGFEAWLAKPWLGWGPDGAIPVLVRTDLPAIMGYDHLHNGPLDVLVRFGLVGAIFFYSIPLVLLRAGWRSLGDGSLRPSCAVFLFSAMATFAAADLTESYLNTSHGWHWLMLIGGAMYTGQFWCGALGKHPSGEVESASKGPAAHSRVGCGRR